MPTINGHHHISMLTKNAQLNNRFYQDVLGLRRVKKTVNQDNPAMYHLFYGDLTGSPGTELSFFEIPLAGSTVRGTNAITRIGMLVPSLESLTYWKNRFVSLGIKHEELTRYGGREALFFEDPEGLRMMLINNNGETVPEHWSAWEDSIIDPQHRILGMGTVEITVRNLQSMANTLMDLFGYSEAGRTDEEAIYQSVAGQAYGEIIVKYEDGPGEKPGKGSVHHLAIRVKNVDELRFWDQVVKERGFHSTGIVDRYYFQSLYFRETNGILFEIATDGPGFTVDATIEELGKGLDLPPFLEDRRAEIEARLVPLD
ncbi:ring-cleaving dioxygenase [Paenibacillus lutrae]|uniref:Ring-cleaving dioxygenase n=1 Tax=Paenibacillus lutrae TaxID=2078573 RepID=A0A7X3FER5_9BACL|nr:ring-cleaving dioxygenase [Paenibacillus lutrae]MVO98317.1 ring-cleaving dioxygenase [Paenibacillus lutrae]